MGSVVSKATDALGLTDSEAGDRAYSAQSGAAKKANKLQEKIYNESKDRYEGYLDRGQDAFRDLSELSNNYTNFQDTEGAFQGHDGVFKMSDFQKDPGYEFRMQEGMKAINNSAAARGGQLSGATLKALGKYGQNFASNEYQNSYNRFNQDYNNAYNRYNTDNTNKFNRLNTLSNYGMNAANSLAGQGGSYAQNVGSNMMSLGNAQANMEMNKNNSNKEMYQMAMSNIGTGMSMMCWVAREIYGEENPKWLEVRAYMQNLAPKWLLKLYISKGERFAKYISDKPRIKKIVKFFFDDFAIKGRGHL